MTFARNETRVELIVVDMVDFNVIVFKNFLAHYHVVLDCYA